MQNLLNSARDLLLKRNAAIFKTFDDRRNFYPEFFFHLVTSVSKSRRYGVSVKERTDTTIGFNVGEKASGQWKIINAPKVPDWIMQLEPQLNKAIQQIVLA